MLDSKKSIILFDDTGKNDDFNVTKILYEDNDVILVEAVNENYVENLKFMIDKEHNRVSGNGILFYLAKNV